MVGWTESCCSLKLCGFPYKCVEKPLVCCGVGMGGNKMKEHPGGQFGRIHHNLFHMCAE